MALVPQLQLSTYCNVSRMAVKRTGTFFDHSLNVAFWFQGAKFLNLQIHSRRPKVKRRCEGCQEFMLYIDRENLTGIPSQVV